MRALGLKALFVFVTPPSLESLHQRLAARGTETEEEMNRRVAAALAEVERCGGFCYRIEGAVVFARTMHEEDGPTIAVHCMVASLHVVLFCVNPICCASR